MKTVATLIRLAFLALFVILIAQGKMVLWLALFAATLLVELVFGRLYCGYVCPMNTVMIPTDWLARKLKLQKQSAPAWLNSGRFAWVMLGLSVVAMLLARRLGGVNLPILPILLIVSILVTVRYHPSVFHNLLCPFGAIQKLFAKAPFLSHRVRPSACTGCRICEKVCPSRAIQVKSDRKAHITEPLCHQCANCAQICPKSAISYGKINVLEVESQV